jgi:hypothetical protein
MSLLIKALDPSCGLHYHHLITPKGPISKYCHIGVSIYETGENTNMYVVKLSLAPKNLCPCRTLNILFHPKSSQSINSFQQQH